MSHDGNCYCPNCDRSYDREGADRYLGYVEARLAHAEERLWNVGEIATRGHVAVSAWTLPANSTASPEPREWRCVSCGSRQQSSGPCQNRGCVPGEVARALAKETRTQRIAARRATNGTPPGGTTP